MITIILFQPVSQPSLNYKDTGNRIDFLDHLMLYLFIYLLILHKSLMIQIIQYQYFKRNGTFQILHPHQQVFPIVYIFKILPIIIV